MSKKSPFAEDKIQKHPSFVSVSFHRITGQRRFFGSSVESQTWVELKVCPAELHHHLGSDSVYSANQPLIEVALSPAQFAELLTTMNSGPGVPGTLQEFNGKSVEQLPEIETETHRIREHFEKIMRNRSQEFRDALAEVTTLFEEKKSLNKGDCKKIIDTLRTMVNQFSDSAPFYLGQFEEAAEKIAVQTKAEVDAFITHAVQSTGLEVLRSQAPRLATLEMGNADCLPAEDRHIYVPGNKKCNCGERDA
jgi:hypothetical protein